MGNEIKSLWFEDALKDKRLLKAIRRLRLGGGDFIEQERLVNMKLKKPHCIRMFFVEGPRGGISGILMANRTRGRLVRLGVYVDRNKRRQNIATSLVYAVRSYYPRAKMRGYAWNNASFEFWSGVRHITQQDPAKIFME